MGVSDLLNSRIPVVVVVISEHNFTVHMPLLAAASIVGLGRRMKMLEFFISGVTYTASYCYK